MSDARSSVESTQTYVPDEATQALAMRLSYLPPDRAAKALARIDDERAAAALALISPASASGIIWQLPEDHRQRLVASAPGGKGEQWLLVSEYKEGTVGQLMERPLAVYRPDTRVDEAIERLRDLTRRAFIVYGFVTDRDGKLEGVFAFRELLFARPDQTLSEIMVKSPFALNPSMSVIEAARKVVTLHVPAYPVVDERGQPDRHGARASDVRGAGVRDQRAARPHGRCRQGGAARHAAGRAASSSGTRGCSSTCSPRSSPAAWWRSSRTRSTRSSILALFLPVLAGQSGNTGCQALAVTLRGMTLGELEAGTERALVDQGGVARPPQRRARRL